MNWSLWVGSVTAQTLCLQFQLCSLFSLLDELCNNACWLAVLMKKTDALLNSATCLSAAWVLGAQTAWKTSVLTLTVTDVCRLWISAMEGFLHGLCVSGHGRSIIFCLTV